MFKIKNILAAGLMAAAATASMAVDITALTTQNATGDQDPLWSGALGMDFNVLQSITITELGAYDSGANGITGPVYVGIFNRATQMLVGSSATFANPNDGVLVGTDRFLNIADFVLAPGSYSIVAAGFNMTDPNGNLDPTGGARTPSVINTGGGHISFVGSSRYAPLNVASLVYPTTSDGGPNNRYDAGTFRFVTAVPEPSTYAMMLAALGVIGSVVRRRSQAK